MNACLAIARKWVLLWVALAGTCAAAQTPSPLSEVRSLMQAGRLPDAAREIARHLQRPDPEPEMQLLQCVVQAQQNQTDKAIGCLTALVKQRPDMLEAYNNLGVLHASLGQHEEAKRWFTLALQRQTTLWTLHQNLQSLQADLSRKAFARALQTELPLKDAPPKLTMLAATSLSQSSSPLAAKTTPLAPVTPVAAVPIAPPAALASATLSPPRPDAQTLPTKPAESIGNGSDPSDKGPVKSDKIPQLNAVARQQVQDAVQAWAQAWSSQNMPRYLSAYAPDYTPGKSITRAAWEAERAARITGRQFVRVKVSNFSFESTGPKVVVRFSQMYESDNIFSNTRKRLELVQLEGRWKITRETVANN